MEASLCAFPATKPSQVQPQSHLLSLGFPRIPHSGPCPSGRRRPLLVRAAISRAKKEATVEAVKQQLENCHLVAGIRYKGLTVKQLQELRRSLPESVRLLVAKNTLVGKAVEGTPWEALRPAMKGMNAWLFVHTEEIPDAIRPYRSFQRERKLEANDFSGAVFEGKFYGPSDFKALETMPTRAEVYAKILGSLQTPAISLVGTLQAPARDLVLVLKAYVKKLEEEEEGGSAPQ
uniref:Large ribosomal subunit protein uL10c n=1 Tax=Anthurium amnicola TaxID=1678845 RepID=A0A1D1YNN2_9ARAE